MSRSRLSEPSLVKARATWYEELELARAARSSTGRDDCPLGSPLASLLARAGCLGRADTLAESEGSLTGPGSDSRGAGVSAAAAALLSSLTTPTGISASPLGAKLATAFARGRVRPEN